MTAPIQSYADTFSDAVAAFKDGHFSTAYGLFYGLAQKEHALAQLNIATMTAKGDGIIQSDKDALFWAWRARLAGTNQAIPIIQYLTSRTTQPLLCNKKYELPRPN